MVLKKIFIIGSSFFIILFISLTIIMKIYVTKDWLIQTVENELLVRVEIKNISVPIFATFSGIEVHNFKLGYADTEVSKKPSDREPYTNEVLYFKLLSFKFKLFDLITSFGTKIYLKELIIKNAKAHIIQYSNGNNNITPLLIPKKKARIHEEKDAKQLKEATTVSKKQKPFNIKDITFHIKVKKLGLEKGNLKFTSKSSGETVLLKNLNLLFKDINIDPHNLKKYNQAYLTLSFDTYITQKNNCIRKTGNCTGEVEKKRSFDGAQIFLNSTIFIKPFNSKTGLLNQYAVINLFIKKNSYINGLKVYERIKQHEAFLKKLKIDLGFLKKKLILKKDSVTKIKYNNGKITFLKKPTFITDNLELSIREKSWINFKNNQHYLDNFLLLSKQDTKYIKQQLQKNIDKVVQKALNKLPREVKRHIKISSANITNKILQPFLDKKTGQFIFSTISKNNLQNPTVIITRPVFQSTEKMIQNNIAKNSSALMNQLKDKLQAEAQKLKLEVEKKAKQLQARQKKILEQKAKQEASKIQNQIKNRLGF